MACSLYHSDHVGSSEEADKRRAGHLHCSLLLLVNGYGMKLLIRLSPFIVKIAVQKLT